MNLVAYLSTAVDNCSANVAQTWPAAPAWQASGLVPSRQYIHAFWHGTSRCPGSPSISLWILCVPWAV